MSLLFGLGAAFGWGVGDFLAAVAGRRIGLFATVLLMQVTAAIVFTIYLFIEPLPELSPEEIAGGLGIGAIATVTYLFLYRGLALGPLAVVSPISASYALVTIGLAVAFRGERPEAVTWAGFGVTLVGVLLVSTNLREFRAGLHAAGKGVLYGLGAMVGLGLVLFFLAHLTDRIGWFAPVFLMRAWTAAILVALAAAKRPRLAGTSGAGALALASAIGVADTLGWLSAGRGVEEGAATITAAASSVYPLIPIALGILVFKEHLVGNQWFGILLILLGLVVIAGSS